MNGAMAREIRTEMKTVEAMIRIACAGRHGAGPLCNACSDLLSYARERLDKCRFGAQKPTCAACPVHCYKPVMREEIRAVMRYAGRRMLLRHPWLTLAHWFRERRRPAQAETPSAGTSRNFEIFT